MQQQHQQKEGIFRDPTTGDGSSGLSLDQVSPHQNLSGKILEALSGSLVGHRAGAEILSELSQGLDP
jgi:hypothetical protein